MEETTHKEGVDLRPIIKKYKFGYVQEIAERAGKILGRQSMSKAWVHENINKSGSLANILALEIIEEGQKLFHMTRERRDQILAREL